MCSFSEGLSHAAVPILLSKPKNEETKPSFSAKVSWCQPRKEPGEELDPVTGNLLFHPAGDFLPVGMQ